VKVVDDVDVCCGGLHRTLALFCFWAKDMTVGTLGWSMSKEYSGLNLEDFFTSHQPDFNLDFALTESCDYADASRPIDHPDLNLYQKNMSPGELSGLLAVGVGVYFDNCHYSCPDVDIADRGCRSRRQVYCSFLVGT
jgi:hypothetical protein